MSAKRSISLAMMPLLLASLFMAWAGVRLSVPPTPPMPGLNSVALATEPPVSVPAARVQTPTKEAEWPRQPERKFVDMPNPKLVARSIKAEPKYRHEPRYCLLTFGSKAETRVWLVEDGDVLYVDRNSNGILGEPGESVPIGPSPLADSKLYKVGLIGSDEKNPLMYEVSVSRYLSDGERNHVIKGKLSESISQCAGWGAIFGKDRDSATVLCFGASLAPVPLRNAPFVRGETERELSFALATAGEGNRSRAWLSYESIPESIHPMIRIQWPGQETRYAFVLKERC